MVFTKTHPKTTSFLILDSLAVPTSIPNNYVLFPPLIAFLIVPYIN